MVDLDSTHADASGFFHRVGSPDSGFVFEKELVCQTKRKNDGYLRSRLTPHIRPRDCLRKAPLPLRGRSRREEFLRKARARA
jgi:hypothetical protein